MYDVIQESFPEIFDWVRRDQIDYPTSITMLAVTKEKTCLFKQSKKQKRFNTLNETN